jgi:hypothetical protein
LTLPDWLPDSVIFKNQQGEKFFVEYTIRAQFRSDKPKDIVVD